MDLVGLLRQNMTYQGIHASLIYYQEVKHKKLTIEYGISVVKFIYNEAKQYYQDLWNKKDRLNNQKLNAKIKTVYIVLTPSCNINTVDMSLL